LKNFNRFSPLKNNKGILTIDFLFAFILVFGLVGIFFAMSLTLSVVEVVQYMTFASARNYFAAHLNEEMQRQQADSKFASLKEHPTFKPLFTNGWFILSNYETRSFAEDYPTTPPQYSTFWGSAVNFEAKMLDIKIPMFGSTSKKEGKSGFSTRISSFLAREPNSDECMSFVKQRFTLLTSKFGAGSANASAYVPIDDNGC
jgi:hypothetical protein